jgi:hypothetical protein
VAMPGEVVQESSPNFVATSHAFNSIAISYRSILMSLQKRGRAPCPTKRVCSLPDGALSSNAAPKTRS